MNEAIVGEATMYACSADTGRGFGGSVGDKGTVEGGPTTCRVGDKGTVEDGPPTFMVWCHLSKWLVATVYTIGAVGISGF